MWSIATLGELKYAVCAVINTVLFGFQPMCILVQTCPHRCFFHIHTSTPASYFPMHRHAGSGEPLAFTLSIPAL